MPSDIRQVCEDIAVWARPLLPVAEPAKKMQLPMQWARLSNSGMFHGARTDDGRTCILLTTRVSWKDNFEGVFFCDAPVRDAEILSRGTQPAVLSIAGAGIFEELYIRKTHDPQWFDVYFDLN